ncbi:tautomerase [Paucibacter sp. AS339]|uniref:tautomerase n=1 Tax=Paucibacter hankyongi TaxID=3133434 RepID=UPI0030AEFDFB
MPNIVLKLPRGAYPGAARERLVRAINEAAALAEQIPDAPSQRALCWVMVEELAAGAWSCGGVDPALLLLLPCWALIYVPAGVLDAEARALYVAQVHAAFQAALPEGESRRLVSSVILHEVPDGCWAANGVIWPLAAMAQAAGYRHLQHLLPVAQAERRQT